MEGVYGAAMTAPEFHLYLPQMRLSMDVMVEKARAAEAAGFAGMAGMDHLAPPLAERHDMYEALTTNAWLLAHTERLVQGQLVLCDAFRHPAVLAREAVTLDHASGGRFELGIGWGSVVEEFTTYGVRPIPARERVGRLKETLEVMRALWTGEALDYDGEWFQLVAARQMPTPLTAIPIVIGGTGPKTMELVAEHADWWNVPVHQLDRLDEMRGRAGDARVSIQRMYTFSPAGADRAAIEEVAQKRFGYSSRVVGGSSEMLDHFHAMRERGVERFYVWFTDFAAPATLEAFGAEIISSY
jgi:alkanesulfonate monooxygenase SsuD/methylene tetrahydromethanopterin reductase-like flavin-dependent oxidoreductase (luciferase family)